MEKIEHVNYENMPNDLNSNSASFSRSNFQLNVEEINWLISIISTEDRAKLTKVARDCSSEINFTRGLPLTAAVCGSIYYARNKLPSQYHFGPKGWPMYLLLTFGTMTFTNLFYAGTCNKRIEPVLNDLYQKYTAQTTSKNSYDALRINNRLGASALNSTERSQTAPGRRYEISKLPSNIENEDQLNTGKFIYPSTPFISGTPYDTNVNNPEAAKSKYGDQGFS